ncbi:hypothetical protein GW17_00052121 [Ensete ventricosum]|nr:hypothetical protein GW17_00052121 [Ensete ventricosum]
MHRVCQGLQFRYLPPGTGGTYQSTRLPVRGLPATERFSQKSTSVVDFGRRWSIEGRNRSLKSTGRLSEKKEEEEEKEEKKRKEKKKTYHLREVLARASLSLTGTLSPARGERSSARGNQVSPSSSFSLPRLISAKIYRRLSISAVLPGSGQSASRSTGGLPILWMQMDSKYRHPSIQLFTMEVKDQSRYRNPGPTANQIPESSCGSDKDGQSCEAEDARDATATENIMDLEPGKIDDWEIRRLGSMAARLLREVKIT